MVRSPKLRPTILSVLAALVLLVVAACQNTPLNTFDPKSDSADSVLSLYILVTVAASLVGAAVLVAMVWMLIKYRARPGHTAQQIHGNNKLEVAWTIAPLLVLLMIGIPTMFWIAGSSVAPGPGALHVQAIGHQWWFEFRYPGLGPGGGDLITANELHVPIGREVAIILESDDVIHSFWVPKLVGKTDMIPGNMNKLETFTPNEIGEFFGLCAEFCGSAHARMRFRIHVDSLHDFNAWVAGMTSPSPEPAAGTAASRGRLLFGTCAGCHTIGNGEPEPDRPPSSCLTRPAGRVGPDLTLFGERVTVGAGILESSVENVTQWVGDVRSLKPILDDGAKCFMPAFNETFSEQEISDLVAYLKSLTLS